MELAANEAEISEPDRVSQPSPEELCEGFAHRVYQFACMVSRDQTAAEDLAQDALVRAITHVHQFDPAKGDLEAWLWRIVTNAARDAGRMAHRRQALLQRLFARATPEPSSGGDPALNLADADLLAAIRELDPRSRAAIALRFGADLDYAAIGSALGISPAAAGMATRRAVAALRTRLQKEGRTA